MSRTPSATKCPMRTPPANSTIPITSVNIMAVDRSGSSITSMSSAPITTRNGSRPLVRRRIVSPFLITSIDVQTTTASLASSEGWSELPNRYRRDPWTRGAIDAVNGKITITNSIKDVIMIGQAHFSQTSASILATTANNATPTVIPTSCRTRRCAWP